MGGTSYFVCMLGVYFNSTSIYLDYIGDVMHRAVAPEKGATAQLKLQ